MQNNILTFPQVTNMFTDLPTDYEPVEVTTWVNHQSEYADLDLLELKARIKFYLDEIEMLGAIPPKNPFKLPDSL